RRNVSRRPQEHRAYFASTPPAGANPLPAKNLPMLAEKRFFAGRPGVRTWQRLEHKSSSTTPYEGWPSVMARESQPIPASALGPFVLILLLPSVMLRLTVRLLWSKKEAGGLKAWQCVRPAPPFFSFVRSFSAAHAQPSELGRAVRTAVRLVIFRWRATSGWAAMMRRPVWLSTSVKRSISVPSRWPIPTG